MKNKIVLITGATSGIGKACAEIFAKNNYHLIITGRRQERLDELSKALRANYGSTVMSLCFDVREKQAAETSLNGLPSEWKNIDLLINNAGLASGMSSIQEGNTDDWDVMIDTNIKGLLYVSRIVIPWMVEKKQGHVINLGSIAGKEAYPNGNVYCATKHAVDALSKAMRLDLLPHGIKVTNIAPGMVETEFSLVRYKGDQLKAGTTYQGLQPLSGEDVADVIYFAASRPDHVNLNDIVLTPKAQAMTRDVIRK